MATTFRLSRYRCDYFDSTGTTVVVGEAHDHLKLSERRPAARSGPAIVVGQHLDSSVGVKRIDCSAWLHPEIVSPAARPHVVAGATEVSVEDVSDDRAAGAACLPQLKPHVVSVKGMSGSRGRLSDRQPFDREHCTTAATFWPALSSDARMVVYVSDAGKDGDRPKLWLHQIGGSAMQLTTGFRDCAEPTFSPDDTRVLFGATGESTRNVYEMPALGGTPRVVKRAARNPSFSPDGKCQRDDCARDGDRHRTPSPRPIRSSSCSATSGATSG